MSAPALRFLVFSLFSLVSLSTGYTARRRGWLHEDASRRVHFYTVVCIWSAALLLSLWRIPPLPENLWLIVIQPVFMAAGAYAMIPLAKMLGCSRSQTAVMVLAGGLSNSGFGLGAYLCYSILHPPEEALAYGLAYASLMNAAMVPLLYPLILHYGQTPGHKQTSFTRLMVKSYFDLRAMPMYAALIGVALAVARVPFPATIDRYHLIHVLAYAGSFGGYFGIGLRLHLGGSAAYLKHYELLAGMKFLMIPAVGAGLLWLIAASPWPLGSTAMQVTRIESAMPTAVIMVALANLFHLDTRMASAVWMWNTACFLLIPLPIILWLWG